ncbi:MAG: SDR family oxidoreductase [Streptomycetaceae bacterium]|nr:SDR family oxidoreductase [Streptomycetaceae bacterium]
MSARFTGKVALVTGGGTGIGRATALALAREGATVVVAGRTESALADTVALVEKEGGTASLALADVTREHDVERLVGTVVARHGGLHVAVNNAGAFAPATPLADLDTEVFRRMLDVNLVGVFLSMKHEIRHMRAHGGGAIVNLGSNIGAHVRRPGLSAYATAKGALSVLTRAAALDHIGDGIRITALSAGSNEGPMSARPGETDAERAARIGTQVPLGRLGSLDEVTSAVLWLASDDAGFAVGTDLVLDGGASA